MSAGESETEAVLMIGYTTEGISNQEQTRWLSWNVDGGVRGLSNNTEYGAGEFPLPTRPTARSTSQGSSRVPSMTRAQQTTEAYPDLGVLKKELEKAQKERNKANLDRDQAKLDREKIQLERDQAVNERDQTLRLLEVLKVEHQQELRVRESAANRDQLKSELERIEQRQRELDAQKGARPKERVVTSSRPESRMEVDEAPRARGRFNLDREAREHMSEGLEVWIPNDAKPSLRGLETQPVRPLMDVVLPGYTPTSTSSDSQVSGGSSRLKELGEKLQQKNRERSARPELPPTWREQPVRSVVISSYKKNTEGRYHRHNRLDWSAEQGARRDCFHDAAWVEYLAPPRVPEGAVHLIIGDSLVRVLTRIQSHWQTGILSFAGAATPHMLATLDMLGMTKVYTVTLMIGTNDVSRGEARKITRLYDKMSCLLEELRIQMDPILLTVCTVPYNMMFDQHALEMNEKVRNLNKVIRDIHRKSVLPVRLLDVAERMEKKGFPEDTSNDGIHFDRPRGAEWLNDVFQEHINTLESDLLETAQFTLGPPPNPPFLASRALSGRLGTRVDARDSSRSIQTRLQSATPMESEESETEKQLESMKYRLTQENGWWPFLTPRLENATNKTREEAPPLVKQVWSFLEKQLELAETRDMTVARFVSAANEVTIGGFWREHAKGELRTRRDYEILKFLSPCWEKEFMAGMFGTTATIFGAFVQEILGMPISLLLALYLVYPRYLFNMGPAYMFSRGVETLRVDGYLALLLLTHGELVSFHRLMEYGEPLSMGRVHSSIETSSYKCAAGLKTLLVQYLMMQNRHMTGEDENPTSREEWKKTNRGMPLLTDLCLKMRSDPMGIIRSLEEVVTCIYGPAVTYAFPDPLVTTYRHSVTHLSLISILDGTALNWCQQEVLRGRMSNTVLFGKVKDAELIVYNFRGQMQCRMGGKREGPIEMYPKFWNLNPLTADRREILRIPAWKECFALVKRELETIMEKEILPATMPEFPIVRRMTLGMNSPLVVPSIMARMTTEEMQKDFTDGWDPLFIGYTAAVYFHTSEAKVNSWTTRAKKMRGSQPPGYEVRKVLRALEQEGLENMLPIWDDGRMIVMEGHVALVDDMKFATRKYRAPYGLEQVEVRQEGKELDAAGQLHVALTEYKKLDPTTLSPLSVDTPGDKRSGPVEDRFKKILERRRHESEEESMDETLSEAGEDMELGNTPEPGPSGEELTTQELLKDLSEENWADTAT